MVIFSLILCIKGEGDNSIYRKHFVSLRTSEDKLLFGVAKHPFPFQISEGIFQMIEEIFWERLNFYLIFRNTSEGPF